MPIPVIYVLRLQEPRRTESAAFERRASRETRQTSISKRLTRTPHSVVW